MILNHHISSFAKFAAFVCVGVSLCASLNQASALDSLKVTVNTVTPQGIGASIGTITFSDSEKGLKIAPNLTGLSAGDHGFHIHENPDCGPKEKDSLMVAAQAAGPHYDPSHSGKHAGPHGGGHMGDLPKLEVAADGSATKEAVLHGVKLSDILNRSVMIHAGGDNYSDTPAPLGGGGARIACGVIR
jgi:Cu-Zn family superoxide dismutase